MVKKKLKPSLVGIENGSQTSQCTSSKGKVETLTLELKDNFFCLEKWQTSQHYEFTFLIIAIRLFNKANLE